MIIFVFVVCYNCFFYDVFAGIFICFFGFVNETHLHVASRTVTWLNPMQGGLRK